MTFVPESARLVLNETRRLDPESARLVQNQKDQLEAIRSDEASTIEPDNLVQRPTRVGGST